VTITSRVTLPFVEGCLKLEERGVVDVILLKVFPGLSFVLDHEIYEAEKPSDNFSLHAHKLVVLSQS